MEDLRNPFIMKFCEDLINKKGVELPVGELSRKVDDLYCRFERMLGKNMVEALPSDKQSEYLDQYDAEEVDFEKIGRIFEEHISNPDEILKNTMKEFSAFFLNRE